MTRTVDLDGQELRSLAELLESGELASTDVVEHAIEHADRLDAPLGLFIARTSEEARAGAAAADARRASGRATSPLLGMPVGVKDILLTEQAPTTAGSLVPGPHGEHERREDAASVARLRAAGAIVVGKANTAEFAIGTPDPTKPVPLARNPWDVRHWAGGSSSGSAAGVVAGAFTAALGTDTGGSIRVPAAFCGVTGFKPTFGLVDPAGCVPLSDSLDHVGPLARSAADCAAVLDALTAGDGSAVAGLGGDLDGLRIGYDDLLRVSDTATDPALPDVLREAVDTFTAIGMRVTPVELPLYGELTMATWVVLAAEAFAQHEALLAPHWSDYGLGTRIFLASGSFYSAPSYVRAQRVRALAHRRMAELFADVDVIVTPTVAYVAPALDGPGGIPAPLDMRGVHTGYWSGLGYPAISIPAGVGAHGLPLAVQVVGKPFADRLVLAVADRFQRATEWHRRLPDHVRCGADAPDIPAAVEGEARANVLATPTDSDTVASDSDLSADLQRLLDAQAVSPSPAERGALLGALTNARMVDDALAALSDAARMPLPNLVLR